jgi:hypothetical protein
VNDSLDKLESRLSEIISVKAYQFGAVGNGSNDDTAEIQAAIDACPAGGIVYFPPGIYMISAPLIVPAYRTLAGNIWAANNATTNARSQIKMVAGGSTGTWGRKAMITHAYYSGDSSDQGPIVVRDLYINGNSQNVGSGIVVMGSCNVIEQCLIDNFNGTTDWTSTSGTAGSGYGVVWTTARYDGTDQGQNAVNSWFRQLRIGCNNPSIFVQKTVSGGITDYVLQDIICLIPPDYTHAKDDIRLEATGGAILRHIHTNGTAGSGIHTVGSAVGFLRITECYLDGWGCGNGSGQYSGIEVDSFTGFDGGNGAPIAISDIQGNFRSNQDGPGSYCFIDVNATNEAEVAINNCTAHIQATSGTHHFFDLAGSSANGTFTISNCIANYLGVSPNFSEAKIFKSSLSGMEVRVENCNWMYGTAAPAGGNWGVGMRRWHSAPAAAAPMGWICTAAGSPGTWRAMPNL